MTNCYNKILAFKVKNLYLERMVGMFKKFSSEIQENITIEICFSAVNKEFFKM